MSIYFSIDPLVDTYYPLFLKIIISTLRIPVFLHLFYYFCVRAAEEKRGENQNSYNSRNELQTPTPNSNSKNSELLFWKNCCFIFYVRACVRACVCACACVRRCFFSKLQKNPKNPSKSPHHRSLLCHHLPTYTMYIINLAFHSYQYNLTF